jgi:hypothetical protein
MLGMGWFVTASVTDSFSFAARERTKVIFAQRADAAIDTSRNGHQIPG